MEKLLNSEPKDKAPTGAQRARLRFSREESFRETLYGKGLKEFRQPSRQFLRAQDRALKKKGR